ncbi:MAG: sulfite exporter TauE/SafE family protein [Clostridia bacterium]|nr:sulfite exporter TauE/SafE family protein [Clostridia bacterium]
MFGKGKFFKRALAGVFTGAINGLFGGGGGMVAVPLLRGMLGYEDKQAHATAIFIIAPICAASAVIYVINGYAQPQVWIPASVGTVAGGLVGAFALTKCPKGILNYIFIALMFIAGVRMLLP